MIRTRSASFFALATLLVACSDVPTNTEPLVKSYGDVDVCDGRVCAPKSATTIYPSSINLRTTQLAAIIIDANAAGLSTLPKGSLAAADIVGPSDTIPGPPGPGLLQSLYARTKGAAFGAALQSIYAAGGIEPSDTIPAPPAPGGGIQRLSNGNLLVWVPVESMVQRNQLTASTQGFIVRITKGNKTLYNSSLVTVGIISPEAGL